MASFDSKSPRTPKNLRTGARVQADGFRWAQARLFGLGIDWQPKEDVYRLSELRETSQLKELRRGTLADCEKALLKTLEARHGTGRMNLPFATLGGKQFWADEFIHLGWRVQRNVFTGHHRLLDPKDVRRAWGDFEACRVVFERQRIEKKLRADREHLVLLVHGLFRSKDSMSKMAGALRKAGFAVESVNYPSTRASIRTHATQLRSILDRTLDYRSVSFVTHSLGGIVVRELLAIPQKQEWRERIQLGRIVMLAPPNQGSVVADALEKNIAYKLLAGDSGQELTPRALANLPAPTCEFAVIAGGTGTDTGYNPILGGDNDGTVLLKNTKLDGQKDFLRVRALHSFIMNDETAIAGCTHFLRKGKFPPASEESAEGSDSSAEAESPAGAK
ncbi:MAG: hypothetical protein AAF517_23885 [Planctomycetota bacterium]